MSILQDFDWIGCVLIGIVLVACGGLGFIVYFAIKDKVSGFASAIKDADPQYKIPENAEYGTFVEAGHEPARDRFLVDDDYVKNYERMAKKEIGVDRASGKDASAEMVMVEVAYLARAVKMLEEYGRLKGFWNELASYMFDHLDMDGGTFQDLGVKHGLLIEAAYSPEIHGDIDTEVGDTIFINPLQEDDSATADDKD